MEELLGGELVNASFRRELSVKGIELRQHIFRASLVDHNVLVPTGLRYLLLTPNGMKVRARLHLIGDLDLASLV